MHPSREMAGMTSRTKLTSYFSFWPPTAIGTARKAALSFTEAARRSGLSLPEATRLVEATWPRTTS